MSPGRVRTCDGWRAALRAPAPRPTSCAQGGQRTSAVCEYRRAGQRDPLGAEMGARWVKRHCSRHAYLIAPPVTPSTTRSDSTGAGTSMTCGKVSAYHAVPAVASTAGLSTATHGRRRRRPGSPRDYADLRMYCEREPFALVCGW